MVGWRILDFESSYESREVSFKKGEIAVEGRRLIIDSCLIWGTYIVLSSFLHCTSIFHSVVDLLPSIFLTSPCFSPPCPPLFQMSGLCFAGGAFGYAKTRSIPSMVAGLGIGSLYALSGMRIREGMSYGYEGAAGELVFFFCLFFGRAALGGETGRPREEEESRWKKGCEVEGGGKMVERCLGRGWLWTRLRTRLIFGMEIGTSALLLGAMLPWVRFTKFVVHHMVAYGLLIYLNMCYHPPLPSLTNR